MFRCDNDIVVIFLKKIYLLKIHIKETMDEMIYLRFASK